MFFRRKKIVDERVINMQNKVYKEIYLIIYLICIASIVIKFIKHGFIVENVLTECIILVAAGIYYSFRVSQLGIFSDEIEMHDTNSKYSYKAKTIFIGVIFGVIIATIMGINSAYNYADSTGEAIYYFFLVFFVTLCIYAPVFIIGMLASLSSLEKKSKKANEKMLEESGE